MFQYVQERKQFGGPLSNLQAVQFKLADMATSLHASRLMIRQAASLLDQKHENATVYCAMAKLFACDKAFQVRKRFFFVILEIFFEQKRKNNNNKIKDL